MQAGYVLLVRDDCGRVFFVGRRDSLAAVLESVDIYTRDPIAAGHFFAVHHDERRRVTWSDDWCAVVEASLAGQIGRRDLGPATYGDVEHTLPESLCTLDASRAADVRETLSGQEQTGAALAARLA